jgi:flagellar biosynthetic protein FliO
MQHLLNRMNQPKKRAIIGLAVILVLCSSVWILGGGQNPAKEPVQTSKPGAAYTSLSSSSLTPPGDALRQSGTADLTTHELFFRTMLAVLFVAALGVGAVFVSKRLLPRIANPAGKEIRVIETTCLGPRKSIHLVEVGGCRLLLGSTNEHITTLANLTDTWADVSRPDAGETVRL